MPVIKTGKYEITMSKASDIYDKFVREGVKKKLIKKENNEGYIKSIYDHMKIYEPEIMVNCSFEDFAVVMAGFSAGRYRFGEEAQLKVIKEKFPNLKKLLTGGASQVI